MYTLSPSKSIKRSNYREFLKDKNVLLIYLSSRQFHLSSDSIVKGIIDDIIKTAVKTVEVDEQKKKETRLYYQRTSTLRIWKVCLHSNMYA
jgi:hypothetical protein